VLTVIKYGVERKGKQSYCILILFQIVIVSIEFSLSSSTEPFISQVLNLKRDEKGKYACRVAVLQVFALRVSASVANDIALLIVVAEVGTIVLIIPTRITK